MAPTLTLPAALHNLRLIGSCKRSPEPPASLPLDSGTISARFRFRTRPGARPVVCSRRSLEGHHMRPTKLSTLACAAAAAAALSLAACSSSGGSNSASTAHPTLTYWASNQGTSLQDDQ